MRGRRAGVFLDFPHLRRGGYFVDGLERDD